MEKRIDAFDQWCLRRILNISWSERVTNSEVRRRTGQPLLSDTVRADQTPQVVWPRGPGGQVSRSFPCSTSLHIARSNELEAASRWSKTYLAKDDGGRSAPIQSWSRVRDSESTKQNNLADIHRNSNVTDKLRLLMIPLPKTAPPIRCFYSLTLCALQIVFTITNTITITITSVFGISCLGVQSFLFGCRRIMPHL